jgi:hypothetical protein
MPVYPDEINRFEPGVVAAWGRTLDLVGQQMTSHLANHVTADLAFSEKGDRVTDELAGLSEPQEVFHDWADSPEGQVPQFRRFAFYRTWNDGKFVGAREQAEKLVNPTSAVTQAMAGGKMRKRDEMIVDVLFKPANEANPDGTVQSKAFPSARVLGVAEKRFFKGKADGDTAPADANVRTLTPAKLRAARLKLVNSKIKSMAKPKIAVEQEDIENMATSIETTSKDYITAMKLADGEATSGFGFDWCFVDADTLPRNADGSLAFVPAWLKEQVLYRERMLVGSKIVQREDKMFRWYAYHEWQTSGLRRQDGGVVHITVER